VETVPLARWESFYVIVGSAAAVLVGLQFVVIALQQDVAKNMAQAVRAFASPTIVHLTAVLSLSAILNMPQHTRTSLGLVLLVVSAALLAYLAWVLGTARTQDLYQPDLGDWIWHYCLPAAAYLGVLVAGALSWAATRKALYLLAGALLSLLIVGIHNAWDSAIYIVAQRAERQRA
jgi:hypothetical protein